MDYPNRETVVNPQVHTMQIIAGALIAGVIIFAAITFFLGAWNEPEEEGLIKYMGLVFAVMAPVPFVLVPSFITPPGVHQLARHERSPDTEPGTLLGVYQARMIVRFALLEGPAFLNLMAFLFEHARWSLGVVAVLVVAMLAMFPTRTRVKQWIEAEQMRSGTGS